MKFFLLLFALLPLSSIAQSSTRTLEFETSEVTQPDICMMPSGKSFVFNLLGHLFEMPVSGGNAIQLTFGNFYDHAPVVSPDGKKIAFVSNRDGSDGNLFLLDLPTKKITQLTNEFLAGSAAWSADGDSLSFLSFLKREEYPLEKIPWFSAGELTSVKTISANGGKALQISESGKFVSPFFNKEGKLSWGFIQVKGQDGPLFPGTTPPPVVTKFEQEIKEGKTENIGTLKGRTGKIAFTKQQDGFYFVSGGVLKFYSIGDTVSKSICLFKGKDITLTLSADSKTIYAAADAKFWKINLADTSLQKIEWKAKVKMEVVIPSAPAWIPPSAGSKPPSEVMTPRLSPDGKKLVFMAAGFLWEQETDGTQARKIPEENSYRLDPSFSPDGKQLAFISDKQGKRELRVYDFATRQTKTLFTVGGYSWALQPAWSADSKTILFQRSDALGSPYKFIKVNVQTGDTTTITSTSKNWNGRPHFSPDGNTVYYTDRQTVYSNLFRLSLQAGAKPQAITNLNRHAHDALISPDGKWIAFRRNMEIWIAPMKEQTIVEADCKLFSKIGGRSFAFTNDGAAIVYADGDKVFKKQLQDDALVSIPVNLKLQSVASVPVLISKVRVLNFNTGKFSEETSLYIENNRIVWIGNESGKTISPRAIQINAKGKYAMPGLMDSHTHAAWTNQQITEDRLIAYGVTSVRDVGSRLDIINSLRDRSYSTQLPVPRYFAGGDIYEGVAPIWGDAFFEINSKQEARDYVNYSKAHGASLIKVYASLPWYIKTEVAAEAKRQNMPVVGHGLALEEVTRSVNFGINSLEHGGPANEDIIKMMAKAGTWLDPTPGIFGAGSTIKLADSSTIDEKFKTFIPAEEIKAARPGRKPTDAALANWKNTLASLKRIHDSRVKLLDGTDALMTGVFHGPSVHWVLQFFSDAGIPAIEVLKIGTLHAAESVGAEKNLGSLESGKLADIILLNADPLQDIKNTMKIWKVIKDGEVFDPEKMREK